MINTKEKKKENRIKIHMLFNIENKKALKLLINHFKKTNECPHPLSNKWLKQIQEILEGELK
jgi:hypothetical protein